MKENHKILHIFSGYGGGISSLIINLIENSKENFTHDIMAFSFKNGEAYLERIKKYDSLAFEMPRPRVDGYGKFQAYITDVMKSGKYDAIHCHLAGCRVKPFHKAACEAGIKCFIIHAHTTKYDSKLDAFLPIRLLSQFCNSCFAVEYMTCSNMASNYIFGESYLKKKKCTLIPNGIKELYYTDVLTEEKRKEYNVEFDISKDENVYIHIGRFSPPKNHSFMLDVIKELKNMDHKFKFLFVGDGELKNWVEEKTTEYGLLDCVIFAGRRSDIPLLIQYAHLSLLPSINEGLPTVAVESQASGTPIMISDMVTPQCDMELNLTMFYPITSPKLWAEEIISQNWREKKKHPKECLEKVKEKGFTAERVGDMYCAQMERIIEKYS